MASSRPTTPVPEECPVCMDTLRAGYARVNWCPLHPLCRECADRIRSGGDCRCPLCRQPWFLEERRVRSLFTDPRLAHAQVSFLPVPDLFINSLADIPTGQIRALRGGDALTISHPDTWIPLRLCSHGNHGYCDFCTAEEESPFDDMNWVPEGGYDAHDYYHEEAAEEDADPYVQQWNEENEEDVPMYVRAYDVSF